MAVVKEKDAWTLLETRLITVFQSVPLSAPPLGPANRVQQLFSLTLLVVRSHVTFLRPERFLTFLLPRNLRHALECKIA